LRRNQKQRDNAFIQAQQGQQANTCLTALNGIGEFLVLTPPEFEKCTGRILQSFGYRDVQHTGRGGDLMADLTATSPQGESTVVQCKRYAPGKAIGTPEIQKFIGMISVHHKAQKGVYVTTSTFSMPARNLAAQHAILLIDGATLIRMTQQISQQQQMYNAGR
jgi:restriction system protein